jgi:hypothetical protein
MRRQRTPSIARTDGPIVVPNRDRPGPGCAGERLALYREPPLPARQAALDSLPRRQFFKSASTGLCVECARQIAGPRSARWPPPAFAFGPWHRMTTAASAAYTRASPWKPFLDPQSSIVDSHVRLSSSPSPPPVCAPASFPAGRLAARIRLKNGLLLAYRILRQTPAVSSDIAGDNRRAGAGQAPRARRPRGRRWRQTLRKVQFRQRLWPGRPRPDSRH